MNENKLIEYLIPLMRQSNDVTVGPGDDCAVIQIGSENILAAVDQTIANIHYLEDTAPEKIAAKLLKRNLSDIAAMGGKPSHALLTIASNRSNQQWYENFYKGMAATAKKYQVAIIGGDIAKTPTIKNNNNNQIIETATLTILGKVKKDNICLRKSAKTGQQLFVTGEIGNSFYSEHHLNFEPRLKEAEFLSNGYTNCAIDISDGLILDAQRIAKASNCGLQIDPTKIPLRDGAKLKTALSDGEDYELLFTVDENKSDDLINNWPFSTPLNSIGRVINTAKGLVIDSNGSILSEKNNIGFVHKSE